MKREAAELTPIGRVIVQAIEHRMSREQLAFRAEMESGTLSKVLRGLQPVGEDRLARLARAAGVTAVEYEHVWLPSLEATRQARKRRLRAAGAPEVARPAAPAEFPPARRGDAPGSPGAQAPDVAAPGESAASDGDLAEGMPRWFRPYAAAIAALEAEVARLERSAASPPSSSTSTAPWPAPGSIGPEPLPARPPQPDARRQRGPVAYRLDLH